MEASVGVGGIGNKTIMGSGIKGQDAKRDGNITRSWVGRGDSWRRKTSGDVSPAEKNLEKTKDWQEVGAVLFPKVKNDA